VACALVAARRWAEGMTLKAAAAGVDAGGGKAVIVGDPRTARTPALLEAFAELVDTLGGDYYTAEDVGTTCQDMDVLRCLSPYVLGRPREHGGSGDPSPFTARGVVASMRAAWECATGAMTLAGARIVVQGAGKVGAGVVAGAAAQGATVLVADVDEAPALALAEAVGAIPLPASRALTEPCDILCPCALGGVLDARTVTDLDAEVVCGAANNQLAGDGAAKLLAARGVLYVPDFVANAGGLMAVVDEIRGFDEERVTRRVDEIGAVVSELIEEARADAITPLTAARRRAARRLAGAGALAA
jgi:glutamate dehydrogenase/leucine dehydrogenase